MKRDFDLLMVWKIKQTQEEKSSKGRRKERKKGERQTHTFLKTLNYSNPKLFFLQQKKGKEKNTKNSSKHARARERKDTRII